MKFKDAAINGITGGISGGITGAITAPIGMGLSLLQNKFNSKQQLQEQEKLMQLQQRYNNQSMELSTKLQKDYFDYTANYNTYENQIKRMEEAGLNPALLYGMSGAGGSTGAAGGGGGMAVTSGTASGAAERTAQQQGMALELAKLASEIEVNESVAAKNIADAKTTDQSREGVVNKLIQEGHGQWIENIRNQYYDRTDPEDRSNDDFTHSLYGKHSILGDSLTNKKLAEDLFALVADKNAKLAGAALDTEKKEYYWVELLIAIQNSNSEAIKANAAELSAFWQTGDLTNWRTWWQAGSEAFEKIEEILGVPEDEKLGIMHNLIETRKGAKRGLMKIPEKIQEKYDKFKGK